MIFLPRAYFLALSVAVMLTATSSFAEVQCGSAVLDDQSATADPVHSSANSIRGIRTIGNRLIKIPNEVSPQLKKEIALYFTEGVRDPLINWTKLPFSQKASQVWSGTWGYTIRTAQTTADFLMPWPTPIFNRTSRIYMKQLGNPDYVPSAKEQKTLASNPVGSKAFELRGQFLKSHPVLTKSRRGYQYGKGIAMGLLITLLMQQAIEMESNTETFEENLQRSNAYDDNTVEVLIESTPFPHTAIRIGTRVYSYGQTHMEASSVYEYLSSPPQVGIATPGHVADDWFRRQADQLSSGQTASWAMRRSVRKVELHLSRQQVQVLRHELEMETGKRYANWSMVNDCSSMIARFLNRTADLKTPIVIDPFPTTMSAYLTLRRLLGDERIGETKLLVDHQTDRRFYLVRNTWIGTVEAKAMMGLLVVNTATRLGFDLTHSKESISFYDPEMAAEIAKWKSHLNQELQTNLQIYGLATDRPLTDIETARLNGVLAFVIQPEIERAKEVLASPVATFKDSLLSQEKVQLLEEQKLMIQTELRSRKTAVPQGA